MSVNFEKLLRKRFGNRWKKTRSKHGLEYRVCCPFCPGSRGIQDKAYKLYMNPAMGVYNCYRCNTSGTLSQMFSEFKNLDDQVFHPVAVTHKPVNVDLPGVVIPLNQLDVQHEARQYLEKRGFNTEVLSTAFGVHYCTAGRVYGDRVTFFFDTTNTIVFPVWMHGKIVGWQARLLYEPDTLTDEQCAILGFPKDMDGDFVKPPKYYTPWGMTKGEVLYNFDNARLSRVVVVSEGPLDVAGIGLCGVATFGKGVSDAQARLIKEYWDVAVLMLDPGDADTETQQLLYKLRMSIVTIPVKLQGVKDPGDASFTRIWTQIYDTAIQYGYDITRYNLGPWNRAMVRTTDRIAHA